jgi:uncharacterized membrane protein (DUF4010 family)
MMAVVYGTAFALYVRAPRALAGAEPVSYRNPFELGAALKFGLLYAVVIFVAKAAHVMLGDPGLFASSLLAGTTDVDPITLSMARFHRDGLSAAIAAVAIVLATMTNTVVKAAIATWLGGRQLAIPVSTGMAAALCAGGVVLILL